jgi:hypothetical protein
MGPEEGHRTGWRFETAFADRVAGLPKKPSVMSVMKIGFSALSIPRLGLDLSYSDLHGGRFSFQFFVRFEPAASRRRISKAARRACTAAALECLHALRPNRVPKWPHVPRPTGHGSACYWGIPSAVEAPLDSRLGFHARS